MSELDLKALWQNDTQDTATALDVEEIKHKASRFERKVQRRNRLEWAACVFVSVKFGYDALLAKTAVLLVGNLLIVAAAFSISLYLWRRGRVQLNVDPTTDTRAFAEAHANAMKGQAELLADVPVWYLGPLGLGLVVLIAGMYPTDGRPVWPWFLVVAFAISVFGAVAWYNHREARVLRNKAEALLSDIN